jgi:ABC-2 type transport system permease protein
MQKLWAFIWKELYTTYTDRNLMLIMLATPLALATVIALAFSGFLQPSGSDLVVRDIAVGIVNHDTGVETNGQTQNNGQIFIDLLVPPPDATEAQLEDNALWALTNATVYEDEAAARAAVEAGELSAAIIIPADFSANLGFSQERPSLLPVSVEVYGNSGFSVSPTIIRGIAESITTQIAAGSITIAATIQAMIDRAQSDPAFGITFLAASAGGQFQPDFSAAFDSASNPISVEQQTVSGQQVTLSPLVSLGSAISIFFLLFTGTASVGALLEEQRDGTLARLLATPTPRWLLIVAKLIGALSVCIVQVIVLFAALTIISSLISGRIEFIWGSNIPLFALVVLAVSLSASGLGALLIGLVRKPEQMNIIASVISIAMGALGGAFFNVDAIPGVGALSRLTIVWWGSDAFERLSIGDYNIGLNLLVLLALGAVMFTAGLLLFNRRLNA